MEWWHVYLFTRLDGLNVLLGLTVGLAGLIAIGAGIGWVIADGCSKDTGRSQGWRDGYVVWKKTWLSIFKPALVAFLFALVGVIATPTQKEAAAIYILPKLSHSDFAKEAQQIPTDAAKLMRMKLESWISDMEPKAGKK